MLEDQRLKEINQLDSTQNLNFIYDVECIEEVQILCNIICIGLTTVWKDSLHFDLVKGDLNSLGYSDTEYAYIINYLFLGEHCFIYLS